jgi:hypothetical protein
MPENILTLGDIFGFLMELLDSRHSSTFLGLFHSVTNEGYPILNHRQGRRPGNDLKSHLQGRERPGGRAKE